MPLPASLRSDLARHRSTHRFFPESQPFNDPKMTVGIVRNSFFETFCDARLSFREPKRFVGIALDKVMAALFG